MTHVQNVDELTYAHNTYYDKLKPHSTESAQTHPGAVAAVSQLSLRSQRKLMFMMVDMTASTMNYKGYVYTAGTFPRSYEPLEELSVFPLQGPGST